MQRKNIVVVFGAIIVDYVLGNEFTSLGVAVLYHLLVLMTALVITTVMAVDTAAYYASIVIVAIKIYGLVMLGVAEARLTFLFGFLVCLSLFIVAERERLRFTSRFIMNSLMKIRSSNTKPVRSKEEERIAALM